MVGFGCAVHRRVLSTRPPSGVYGAARGLEPYPGCQVLAVVAEWGCGLQVAGTFGTDNEMVWRPAYCYIVTRNPEPPVNRPPRATADDTNTTAPAHDRGISEATSKGRPESHGDTGFRFTRLLLLILSSRTRRRRSDCRAGDQNRHETMQRSDRGSGEE